MNESSTFDRLRAWAEGTLSGSDLALLQRELASDPEFARQADDFRAVWSRTKAGLGDTPLSKTSFDDVMRRARADSRRRYVRRAAAALLILVPIASVVWFAARPLAQRDNRPVVLHSIPLVAHEAPCTSAPSIPAFLVNWSPVDEHSIHWLDSLDDARAASAAVGRPVFVFGYVPGCPLCKILNDTTFQDQAVLGLLERAVPVAIDLSKLEPEEFQTIYARRYPLLEFQDSRGGILHTFAGTFLDVDVRAELAANVNEPSAPAWGLVHRLTTDLVNARSAEARDDMVAAVNGFEELARHDDAPAFESQGQCGVQRLADGARVVLEAARAGADAPNARAEFERSVLRFRGTHFENDLQAVIDAWRDSGRFPELAAP